MEMVPEEEHSISKTTQPIKYVTMEYKSKLNAKQNADVL
jgi:hypothetical protein